MQKNDTFASQISRNIFKLGQSASLDFNVEEIFSSFNQPALIRFYEQHQKLGVDIAPFVFGMTVHGAVMLDGADIYNPDSSGFLTGVNLFTHLIGEPDKFPNLNSCRLYSFLLFSRTNKSGLFRMFSKSMAVLARLFPDFFMKSITEEEKEMEKSVKVDLVSSNDTELSLFQRLSKRVRSIV